MGWNLAGGLDLDRRVTMAACTKNHRKLLGIFPYRGPHHWKIVRVNWNMVWWEIDRRCIYCHANSHSFGHEDVEMIVLGFDIVKLHKLRRVNEDQIPEVMETDDAALTSISP